MKCLLLGQNPWLEQPKGNLETLKTKRSEIAPHLKPNWRKSDKFWKTILVYILLEVDEPDLWTWVDDLVIHVLVHIGKLQPPDEFLSLRNWWVVSQFWNYVSRDPWSSSSILTVFFFFLLFRKCQWSGNSQCVLTQPIPWITSGAEWTWSNWCMTNGNPPRVHTSCTHPHDQASLGTLLSLALEGLKSWSQAYLFFSSLQVLHLTYTNKLITLLLLLVL
jgi:hypothetical protein